ncbi:MAG: hypothetical protein PWQ52_1182 [Methanolobus sp.]|nr:hypothetical protein [Methanolobus sp.]
MSKYRQLLKAILSADYLPMTVHDHLVAPVERSVILRHDVDREVGRNLAMARLEHSMGIRSTYYFRHVKDVFIPDAIREVAAMGHEVGFHYEVMDKAKGDKQKALSIFREELEDLRRYAEVTTACMHGNPLASWSNRDLWTDYDFWDFGLIGEPYFSMDYSKVLYLTDTGRTWADRKIRVKDILDDSDASSDRLTCNVRTTDDVIGLVSSREFSQICILAHPNRWCDGMAGWTRELVMQNVKNVGKAGIIQYRKFSSSKSKSRTG